MSLRTIVDRLGALPRKPAKIWQGGIVRTPGWIAEPGVEPYRAGTPMWVDLETGLVGCGDLRRWGESTADDAVRALADFACNGTLAGYCPGKLEVNDSTLAGELDRALAGLEIRVVHRESLLGLRRVLDEMARHLDGGGIVPAALDAPGVTPERMRAFAEAAKALHEAAPWRHLEDVDLVEVEAGAPDASLRWACVLGAAGECYGLALYESPSDYWRMNRSDPAAPARQPIDEILAAGRGLWHLGFGPIHELPQGDDELWMDHDFPVAARDAYPFAIHVVTGGRVRRPTARVLGFLEGFMWALAATTESDLDGGRWSKEVSTFDGPATIALALPDLLHPPDLQERMRRGVAPDTRAIEELPWRIGHYLRQHPCDDGVQLQRVLKGFAGRNAGEIPIALSSPLERAQQLCYEAFGAFGRRRLLLARQAISISADCADAFVILAERCGGPEEAIEQFAHGVQAGERALGAEVFAEQSGNFWGIVETRPYMRACFGLAECLDSLGRDDEAIAHYRQMLRLNPNDNQGVRYYLLPLLIEHGCDDEAAGLISRFRGEKTPLLDFAKALLSFRRQGDTAASRKLLRAAVRINPLMADRLTAHEAVTSPRPESFSPDSTDEAMVCADLLEGAWMASPGALAWLERTIARSGRRRALEPRSRRQPGRPDRRPPDRT